MSDFMDWHKGTQPVTITIAHQGQDLSKNGYGVDYKLAFTEEFPRLRYLPNGPLNPYTQRLVSGELNREPIFTAIIDTDNPSFVIMEGTNPLNPSNLGTDDFLVFPLEFEPQKCGVLKTIYPSDYTEYRNPDVDLYGWVTDFSVRCAWDSETRGRLHKGKPNDKGSPMNLKIEPVLGTKGGREQLVHVGKSEKGVSGEKTLTWKEPGDFKSNRVLLFKIRWGGGNQGFFVEDNTGSTAFVPGSSRPTVGYIEPNRESSDPQVSNDWADWDSALEYAVNDIVVYKHLTQRRTYVCVVGHKLDVEERKHIEANSPWARTEGNVLEDPLPPLWKPFNINDHVWITGWENGARFTFRGRYDRINDNGDRLAIDGIQVGSSTGDFAIKGVDLVADTTKVSVGFAVVSKYGAPDDGLWEYVFRRGYAEDGGTGDITDKSPGSVRFSAVLRHDYDIHQDFPDYDGVRTYSQTITFNHSP